MRIPDHYVRVVELPAAVRGVTVPNDDGTFSVYINALYDDETQRETLEHELTHLARDHFYREAPIADQEAEAAGAAGPEVRPAPAPRERRVRLYAGRRALEEYLRSVGALDRPLEELGLPM